MFHLQFGRFSGSRSRYGWRIRLSLMTGLLITTLFITVPALAASEQQPQQKHTLTLNKKWIGDFDGMVKDRSIRVLVVYSKTFYFLDQGRQRGISHDLLKEFEKFVYKKYQTKTWRKISTPGQNICGLSSISTTKTNPWTS